MTRARITRRRVDGVLLLDKPKGLSSNAALQRARWLYRAEKAGHTGTLDPLASGLLPLCFGEATKFAQRVLDARKGYVATLRFGVTTTTGDAEGGVLETRPVSLSVTDLMATLARFVGTLLQTPPMYSALKFEGRPYYDYARAGEDVPRTAREIVVHAIDLLEWNPPYAIVAVECSKGTYIRVLAEDIGGALGCGAHLAGLRRTASGAFRIEEALTLECLETLADEARERALKPVDVLVADLPRITVGLEDARRFKQGQALRAPQRPDGECAVFETGIFLGVATVVAGIAQPSRVVVPRI